MLKRKIMKDKNTEMDLDKWFDTITTYQKLEKKQHPKTRFVKLGDKSRTKPIALIFTADWHLGSKSCDYKQWVKDMKFILGLPPEDFRLVLVGDLVDNVFPRFKSAEAVFGYMSPKLQKEMLEVLLKKMRPYIDVACWGNHDVTWDEKLIGYSDVADMLGRTCSYFHGVGLFDYVVGKQSYRVLMTHKTKGHSWFHALHGNIREWLQTKADVVIGAHGHEAAYMVDYRGSDSEGGPKERHLLQIGTYKTLDDTYSDREFRPGVIHNDTMVFYPNENKIMHFSTVNDAAKWMGIVSKPVKSFSAIK
jgi:hypothetical protein